MLQKTSLLTSNFRLILATPQILRKMSSAPDDVIFTDVGDKGVITLNRPRALNALDLSMISKLYPKLVSWEKEKKMVIIKGAGGKAFCAGGDVKSIVQAGLKGDKLGHIFFKHEYTTNGLIGNYKIPYIAFIDGIVMGGGVGLSVHGRYRVATEKSVFAMPETQIGLFPDVGGSYFLPRLKGKLGLFLALTGYRLKGADILKAGIATHYTDSKNLDALEADLLKCSNQIDIDQTLDKHNLKETPGFTLEPYLDQINDCFSGKSVENIIEKLEKNGSPFAQDMVKLLAKMSPTSMKVTFKELEEGSKKSLAECLKMEYRIAIGCLSNKDFYEGVRALLIDKDQKPKWDPAKLPDVTPSLVDRYFEKLPDDQELRHKL